MRVLALDYGSARCGCALSDPTGTIVTPVEVVQGAATRRGLARLRELVREREVERVVVGLPLGLDGGETEQTRETRAFARELARRLGEGVPVELHDERFTTRMAQRLGAGDGGPTSRGPRPGVHARSGTRSRGARRPQAGEDARAAAHLLESWLAAQGR